MKKLSIQTLIPISAASCLIAVGCGGKAIDDPNGTGGDGDGPGPNVDPLSDANFDDALEDEIEEFCDQQAECGNYFYGDECEDVLRLTFTRIYDTDSRNCRELILETFDCVNDSFNCRTGGYSSACEDSAEELYESCTDYSYFYYDYDYYY